MLKDVILRVMKHAVRLRNFKYSKLFDPPMKVTFYITCFVCDHFCALLYDNVAVLSYHNSAIFASMSGCGLVPNALQL